ncbi:MAG: hypothetical protein O2924_03730 [Chloroflexi bacterium]|nr:hypothetical protein [Chloroflexota bacterium]MQC17089.1 hypothetical protein [Chloroflexota bacterium]
MPSTTLTFATDAINHIDRPVLLIATVKDVRGEAVPGASIGITLIGDGLLIARSGNSGRTMLFPTTDESGTAQFTWQPGTTTKAHNASIHGSSARGDSLTIRTL